jgi:PHD/YefM family antitoxin component YafN of YafNO toxin-antitoxin module
MAKERQFVLNKRGEKVAVVLSIEEYEELLEEIEDLQAVREYEKTQASGETPIPLEQALTEIRRNRK